MDLSTFLNRTDRKVFRAVDKPITDEDLVGLADQFPELEHVVINNCDFVTNAGLIHIARLRALKRLDLESTSITSEGIEELLGLKTVESLGFNYTSVCEPEYLGRLKCLKRLRQLHLCDTWLTDEGVAALSCLKLTQLTLARTATTDAGLAHLEQMKTLEWLDVEGDKIGDTGMRHVAALSNLKHLNLARTGVTDAGLGHLSGLTKLEKLSLSHTKFSDAGIPHLSGLRKLTVLSCEGTRVSPARLRVAQLPCAD